MNNRQDRRGGGVALYVPTQLNYRVLNKVNVMNDLMESVFVGLFFPGRRNVIVGVVYRPPQGNVNLFINEMQTVLSNSIFLQKTVFVMGDYNVNLLQYDENAYVCDFLNMFISFSLLPLITKPIPELQTLLLLSLITFLVMYDLYQMRVL